MFKRITWTEDDGSVWTLSTAGWIFLALTVISVITLIGCCVYSVVHGKSEGNDADGVAITVFMAIVGIITGVISTPFCVKCVKSDKSLSQVLKELIHTMIWGA